MSFKILTALSGIGGLSTMTILPIANSSPTATLMSNSVTNIFDYKINNSLVNDGFTIKVTPFENHNYDSTYGLNSFPIGYTENLSPGRSAGIPLTLAWTQAQNLKQQASSNGWNTWGYTGASFLSKGRGSNGIVTIEAEIAMNTKTLAPFIFDLDAVTHGAPVIPVLTGKLKTKVISTGAALVVQMYYVNLSGLEVFLMQSNPFPSIALGAVLAFGGTITTTDFHS